MKARVPGMTKGGGNMNAMLLKAQKMQEDMANLQQDLDEREYTATSGGGIIEVTITGKHEIKSLKISPDAIDPDDIEMLEDLITVAVNEAISNATKTAENEMGEITSGLNIPGMPGMF